MILNLIFNRKIKIIKNFKNWEQAVNNSVMYNNSIIFNKTIDSFKKSFK